MLTEGGLGRRSLDTRDESTIEPSAHDSSRDDAAQRQFAFGSGQERSGQFDLKRFMHLARGMGIPADDAARLAMNIVFEQRRAADLRANDLRVAEPDGLARSLEHQSPDPRFMPG